jgi:hypothetical protein
VSRFDPIFVAEVNTSQKVEIYPLTEGNIAISVTDNHPSYTFLDIPQIAQLRDALDNYLAAQGAQRQVHFVANCSVCGPNGPVAYYCSNPNCPHKHSISSAHGGI